ncbi:MAG: thiamine-phosphate kinase [Chitinispirillaceae bacterium]|nr:thiamine-phosphate kinase [Chitinispirillaceae bacterium]
MKAKNYPSGEYKLLEELKKTLGPACLPGGHYELTPGDDAAVRRGANGERLVLTADIAVEDVHFTTDALSFEEIGFRAMAANVSDCAAMAALPEAALVQLVFPAGAKNLQKNIVGLYKGFAKACRRWNFKLVGGDLCCGKVWTIGITMLGTAPGRVLRRQGIRAGDALWLSGFPGRSAAGLAAVKRWGRNRVPKRFVALVASHIRPEPPVKLGVALGRCGKVHAMMDLSDGISKDARTLCFENRLGLELTIDGLNVPQEMRALSSELNVPWQEWALHGGEDYTLLFAAPKSFSAVDVPKEFRNGLSRLGVFTDKHNGLVMTEGHGIRSVPRRSWDHI